jgi:DNA repair protein REV1
MVKPPKTMQPEAVDLKKAGRDVQKSFEEDSFRNYMARKIDMQRKQFGLLLPPPPVGIREPNSENTDSANLDQSGGSPARPKTIRFAPDTFEPRISSTGKRRQKRGKKFGVTSVLKRLKRKHGKGVDTVPRYEVTAKDVSPGDSHIDRDATVRADARALAFSQPVANSDPIANQQMATGVGSLRKHRADLFFSGVVVMVNGYTEPDIETLQRMLHKHGGDLERYETSRITHIIAENLSTAKAKMYQRQRNARPVCKPKWIVDCVHADKLLPIASYVLREVKDDATCGTKSIVSFFQGNACQGDNVNATLIESKLYAGNSPVDRPLTTGGVRVRDERTMSSDGAPIVSEPNDLITLNYDDADTEKQSIQGTNSKSPTDQRYVNGRVRTVGTDPNFLESFFASSRLSFIGSYKQRAKQSKKNHQSVDGTSNERFVFHVDMDCFFAAVALRKYPQLRDKPVAISHLAEKKDATDRMRTTTHVSADSTSECATCNYEARKFGIKKGMFLGRAKTLCPDLVILPYDFEGYEEVSDAVSAILDRYASENSGYVEHVSCDEAYVEFHMQIAGGTSSVETVRELAESIRMEIFDVTQCTATVGVGQNKLLAKLATDHVKPNKSFVIEDYRDLLRTMKLRELHGIGYRMERKLAEEKLGTVQDVWDMGARGESELCRILGPALGKKIFGFCHGKDDRPIQPAERKTIGAEVSCL